MTGPPPQSILVVEDDADVRNIISLMLDAPRRRILVAGNAAEAMTLAASTHIDVLLTDIILPGINGDRVALMVNALQPDVPVVYVSGWYEHPHLVMLDGATVLYKPFSRDQLNAAIADALAGGDAP